MALAVISGQLSQARASSVYRVSAKVVSRWVERFRTEGLGGIMDRSSRPQTSPRQTDQALVERIIGLRQQRLTDRHIAMETGVSPATVSRVLKRAGLSRMKDITPAEPVVRYEYAEPSGLIPLNIKRLGRFHRVGHRITGDRTGQSNSRGVGWEYVHVCIDDAPASPLPTSSRMKRQSAPSPSSRPPSPITTASASRSRVMSDNGSCYKACKTLGLSTARRAPALRH